MKQLSFLKQSSKSFGGELLKNKRKSARPLSSRKPTHLVLRSHQVLKSGSFHKHRALLKMLLKTYTKKYGVVIYDISICSNHIHLALRFTQRREFINFLRVFCGQVAQKISKGKNFWEYRPFTRVLEWGKDFKGSLGYILINELETNGVIHYQKRQARFDPSG